MRTLHIITGLEQGGAERQLTNMVSRASDLATVFSIKQPGCMADEIHPTGTLVYSGRARHSTSLAWLPRLRQTLERVRPNIVMGWMYHGNLAASLCRLLGHRGPILWNVRHSVHNIRMEKAATRRVIRAGAWLRHSPARIVYNSTAAAEQHERIGYPVEKRVTIPNGFDLKRFRPDANARKVRREEFGVPPEQPLLGVIGRSHPMKNHAGWIDALRRLRDQGHAFHCVVAGNGVNDPQGPVQTALRGTGLHSRVTLLPPTHTPETLYPALDLLVMPSLWGESFPNVVGEAMACGVPALVTDVGDAARVVGETGFIAEDGSPETLATCTDSALRAGLGLLSALGLEARNRMVRHYGIKTVTEKYSSLFESLMTR